MIDSGIEYTKDPYRPVHAQLVGRKRCEDDDTLMMPCTEAPDGMAHINAYCLSQRTQIVPPREAEYKRTDRDGPQITRIKTRPGTGGQPKIETGKNYGYRDLR